MVTDFGATLAKFHDALDGMVIPPSKMQWFSRSNAKESLDNYSGPLKGQLAELLDQGDELFALGLPTAVVHADLWLGNVFADGDKVTAVFDMETAENTVRIMDLARTYTSMRRATNFSPEAIVAALFDGYDSVARLPLTAEERNNFNLAIAYVAGVCALWHAEQGSDSADEYIELGRGLVKKV